jgi:hypothetical protein
VTGEGTLRTGRCICSSASEPSERLTCVQSLLQPAIYYRKPLTHAHTCASNAKIPGRALNNLLNSPVRELE